MEFRESSARVVAVGNFDGVHRGHQAVLASVAEDARRRGAAPAVLTFSPHPRAVLGRPVPPLLTTLERKAELIARIDPSIALIVRRFDPAFAAWSPGEFVHETLIRSLGATVVVVGHNFRFGKDRAGDFDELARLGQALGFETRSHELVGDEVGPWSSSRVRDAIARGDLDDATRMLGRPHMLSGVVVEGDRRGRTIGFPTCNLAAVPEMLPPFGVYAVRVEREEPRSSVAEPPDHDTWRVQPGPPASALADGVANVGVRPTVKQGESRPSVEVHLFDVDEDLYGARLRVHLVARLRAERRFGGLDELRAQIARDAAEARERLSRRGGAARVC